MGQALEIKNVSATGERTTVSPDDQLCMLIDTTTCIGCKACEVACVEWNDLKLEPEYGQRIMDSYQTMPEMTPSYWNLIKFDEIDVDAGRKPIGPEAATDGAGVMMLMRKDMCLHCAEPGCMAACPAEGAIVQFTNGIVDFQQENCIGCGYCMTGCPFNIPKFDPASQRVFKCTMCSDRVSNGMGPACVKTCPTGCLEFGSKPEMLRRAEHRVEQLKADIFEKDDGFKKAGVYDPPGVGGTGVIYVLHYADKPELYGGLPKNPEIAPAVRIWKGPLKWIGGLSFAAAFAAAAVHYLRSGPQREARTVLAPSAVREIQRYTIFERGLHWTIALCFLYLASTGLGLFSPKMDWLLAVLGGGQVVRAWHPIVGCVFSVAVLVQFTIWFRDIVLTPNDYAWLKQMKEYLAGQHHHVPPSGRFNAGQKLLAWTNLALGILLLASGIPLWFPEAFPLGLRAVSLLVHSASGVLSILAIIVHVYMSIIIVRGGFRAMTEGKVTEEWARQHHATWADEKMR